MKIEFGPPGLTSGDGPAFPVAATDYTQFGMTLRDYFAAKAMQALISTWTPEQSNFIVPDSVAAEAFEIADAMIEARLK